MACMKCGRDTQDGQVFCETCLELMEWYPVKPGTAVQLPKRQDTPVRKNIKRRGPTPEDQIKRLRRVIRVLSILLVLMTILVGLTILPAYEHFMEDHFRPGQNYSTVIPTAPAAQPRDTSGN